MSPLGWSETGANYSKYGIFPLFSLILLANETTFRYKWGPLKTHCSRALECGKSLVIKFGKTRRGRRRMGENSNWVFFALPPSLEEVPRPQWYKTPSFPLKKWRGKNNFATRAFFSQKNGILRGTLPTVYRLRAKTKKQHTHTPFVNKRECKMRWTHPLQFAKEKGEVECGRLGHIIICFPSLYCMGMWGGAYCELRIERNINSESVSGGWNSEGERAVLMLFFSSWEQWPHIKRAWEEKGVSVSRRDWNAEWNSPIYINRKVKMTHFYLTWLLSKTLELTRFAQILDFFSLWFVEGLLISIVVISDGSATNLGRVYPHHAHPTIGPWAFFFSPFHQSIPLARKGEEEEEGIQTSHPLISHRRRPRNKKRGFVTFYCW